MTWIPNRTFAFGSNDRRVGDSLRCLATQSLGSAINVMVFSGMVMVFGAGKLPMPLAAGSLGGPVFSFPTSKHIVFNERPEV